MKDIKIGFIGLGGRGRGLLRASILPQKRAEVVAVCDFDEEKLKGFFGILPCTIDVWGHYPPWEFKENSPLQRLYIDTYKEITGVEPAVVAIHAGLECGTFADALSGLNCISIGPDLFDVRSMTTSPSGVRSTRVSSIFGLCSLHPKHCRRGIFFCFLFCSIFSSGTTLTLPLYLSSFR